ncbi:MAG TPA: 3'-5' exonuclease, partial [Pirellulaceae bacterium]|nr:3'-5' exonuclease [Pirellulaceae bacterium]
LADSQFIALAIRKRHELKLDKLDRNATKSLDQFLAAEATSESSTEASGEPDRTPLGTSLKALEALLERGGWVTAQRATVRFLRFLESDNELLSKLRGELSHLLIDDEARLTALQRRLVDLLAPASVERFVTVLETPAENVISTSFKLSVVQRSRPKIAIIARRMFSPRAVVSSKFAVRAGGECEIVPWSARTDEREVEVIADQIRDLQSVGWPYRSMAVLYRSLKPAATSLIRALEVRGIPYQCAGRSGLLLQPEARHLAEIYSWMGDGHWQDEPQSPVRPADMQSGVRGLARLFRIAEIRLPDLYKHFESWKRSYRSPEKPITLREDFDAHLEAIGADRLTDATPRGASRLLTFARLWQLLDDYHQTMVRGTERLNERATAPSFGRGGDGAG